MGDEYNDEGFVVCNANGTTFSPTRLNKLFAKIIEKAQLPTLRFHDLRHTFSSIMADVGIPSKARSEMLGHADEDITNTVYTHAYDETKVKASEILDELIFGKDETDGP